MTITLGKEVVKQTMPAQSVTVNSLTVLKMIDTPKRKTVIVFLSEVSEPITLWEGEAYDAIGQWTNTNVEERLKELFN